MSKRTVLGFLALLSLVAGCQTPFEPVGSSPVEVKVKARGDIPPEYYDKAEGLTGEALLSALHQTVSPHRDLGYDAARDVMFSQVDDLDGDDVVVGVYTGKRVAHVTDRASAYVGGLNAEHTWPQSLGAEGPGKADLHHLFPADIATNNKRGSFPFGEIASLIWEAPDQGATGQTSRLGSDGTGATVWEPRNLEKGNVARALFYFYTCYAVQARGPISVGNFRRELPLLLKWHQVDPVDAEEQARNQAVYKAQGNRNPFVDHPEYVTRIGNFLAP